MSWASMSHFSTCCPFPPPQFLFSMSLWGLQTANEFICVVISLSYTNPFAGLLAEERWRRSNRIRGNSQRNWWAAWKPMNRQCNYIQLKFQYPPIQLSCSPFDNPLPHPPLGSHASLYYTMDRLNSWRKWSTVRPKRSLYGYCNFLRHCIGSTEMNSLVQ